MQTLLDTLRLIAAWSLPWLVGALVVVALRPRFASMRARGELAWIAGCGWFVGAFALTCWMRLLSALGATFSFGVIAIPLAIAAVALAVVVDRRTDRRQWRSAVTEAGHAFAGTTLSGAQRALWIALIAWLALRAALLLFDVVTMPLYPWDAWIQWATKARVWYELGHIVPFERSEAWFASDGHAWFDAAPNYPATVPLWQVFSNLALGRWDDSLMNLPWWLLQIAFMLVAFGALRRAGVGAIGALIGTWLVASLPLANVHVALAGYADLPMAAYYAVASLAAWRWTSERSIGGAATTIVLMIACVTIKTPGIVWALTLIPAIMPVLFPHRWKQILGGALALCALALIVLARMDVVVLGYRLHLDFAPPWFGMFESMFLLGNWHLLWYAAVAIAIIGWRQSAEKSVLPLTLAIVSGLLFLFVVFAFTTARAWVADQTTVNRATLHLAPLISLWIVIVFHAWLDKLRSAAVSPAASAV